MASSAHAQFVGYNSPQGVNSGKIINAATGPTTAAVSTNLGQTIHFVTYTTVCCINILDIRLEASYDNVKFFAISDDATDTTQGEVVAIGYYPFLRVNLATAVVNGGSITVNYSGTSSTAGSPWGFYNPAQQIRKVVLAQQPAGTGNGATVIAPFGSTAGMLIAACEDSSGAFATCPAGSTITPNAITGNWAIGPLTNTFPLATAVSSQPQFFPQPATPATSVSVTYNSGGPSSNFVLLYYIFYPPGGGPTSSQPPITANTETTAVNGTATATVGVGGSVTLAQRAYVFSVSGRCSAGSAQVLVRDGGASGTILFSSGASEVGTSTYKYQWSPGLASSTGNTLTVQLSTCGVANTGTLDVQGSAF